MKNPLRETVNFVSRESHCFPRHSRRERWDSTVNIAKNFEAGNSLNLAVMAVVGQNSRVCHYGYGYGDGNENVKNQLVKREFKIPRWRRLQKRRLKSDFANYETLVRLSQLGHNVLSLISIWSPRSLRTLKKKFSDRSDHMETTLHSYRSYSKSTSMHCVRSSFSRWLLTSLRKHPFLIALRRWGRFAPRNICGRNSILMT